MARTHQLQSNFTGGELSPRIAGHVDLKKYFSGLRKLENFTIYVQGGAPRRPGTRFVAEVKTSSKMTRLFPFEFSNVQAYVLEVGDSYFRFYKDNGRIESPPGTPVEISSPYLEADLFQLQFAQSGDTLYIAHEKYAPRKLTRTSHTSWTLTRIIFKGGPFLPKNTTATTCTASATTGNITITSSAPLFQAGHVDALWRVGGAGDATITAFNSSTSVNATVNTTLGGLGPTTDWNEGAWSTVQGFPRSVSFHELRLWWGGSTNVPQGLWGSKNGDFENHTPGSLADDPINVTIASNKVNAIQWIMASRVLLLGTLDGEFQVTGGSDAAITPANIKVKSETSFGSILVGVLRVGNVILFVQRHKKKIRELGFNFTDDAYAAPDLTLIAEHATGAGLTQQEFQRLPDPTLWAVRTDGQLLGVTYDRSNEVIAAHRHITDQAAGAGDGIFESIAVIPEVTNNYDQLWCIVKRKISGVFKRYVEFFDPVGNPFSAYAQLNVDAGLTYNGALATVFGGLSHLEGRTVQVVGDGAVYNNAVVSGGQITISPSASKVEVGLPYVSTLETMEPEVPTNQGTSQGLDKRWTRIALRLLNSLGAKINGEQLPFRSSADLMDQPPALFTGDYAIPLDNTGWGAGRVTVKQEQPLPLTVLALFGTIEVSDA